MAPIVKDPPSVRPMNVRSIWSAERHRNRGMPGIARELNWPNDRLLIATLVAHGQPQWSAEQIRHYPPARYYALSFWLDVQDAAEGDPEARARVDYCREQWQEMRKAQVISDRPSATVGIFER